MQKSDDIVNLFQQFGGKADSYQEIAQGHDSQLARARWPLLSALDAAVGEQVPPVQPAENLVSPPTPAPASAVPSPWHAAPPPALPALEPLPPATVAPAPVSLVFPASAQPVSPHFTAAATPPPAAAMPKKRTSEPVLQGTSPLARLARPASAAADEETPGATRPSDLKGLFARLGGARILPRGNP
ncbi:cellulose biosynthesis protein BcsP [Ramlibacter sp. H39-3-26]|uniref:cellulose biosynthesis protein BcsP n=1 Tax=Curvibacter soli TaxID=3031331 RepID=UPI0023D9F507|nr:cellulose biosynthesis protein BcsP [Ramlibacter sp. H39-3-26]MDF1486010.1 cellulose biosynthesis protein BcsP [Ramlibacter sp. H39-3-26]